MARPKTNISVYELDAYGKYVKSGRANRRSPFRTPPSSLPKCREKPGSCGNPFMYNPETSAVSVYSLEDFLVTYKKKNTSSATSSGICLSLRIRRRSSKELQGLAQDYVKNKRRVFGKTTAPSRSSKASATSNSPSTSNWRSGRYWWRWCLSPASILRFGKGSPKDGSDCS